MGWEGGGWGLRKPTCSQQLRAQADIYQQQFMCCEVLAVYSALQVQIEEGGCIIRFEMVLIGLSPSNGAMLEIHLRTFFLGMKKNFSSYTMKNTLTGTITPFFILIQFKYINFLRLSKKISALTRC